MGDQMCVVEYIVGEESLVVESDVYELMWFRSMLVSVVQIKVWFGKVVVELIKFLLLSYMMVVVVVCVLFGLLNFVLFFMVLGLVFGIMFFVVLLLFVFVWLVVKIGGGE